MADCRFARGKPSKFAKETLQSLARLLLKLYTLPLYGRLRVLQYKVKQDISSFTSFQTTNFPWLFGKHGLVALSMEIGR